MKNLPLFMHRTHAKTRHAKRATAALIGLAAVVLLLPGCATLSEGECLTADWYQIGQQDGRHGFKRARLHKHQKACAEHGVRPDENAYYAGRLAGLESYCTPSSGFRRGRDGDKYTGVCPPEWEPAFLSEFRKGEELYGLDQEIKRVERDIASKETLLDEDDTSDELADRLRRELRDLHRELRHLSRELITLEQRYLPRSRY
ncbi:MAG TPA: DUF2799 domain-containing protein [Wenzhouxiangella sp.]|nr:DUF2799 domain-containing protein [Wenzhouxiangella sp.]